MVTVPPGMSDASPMTGSMPFVVYRIVAPGVVQLIVTE